MPLDRSRLRASDADRDRAAALLREHHAEGRITKEEFEERLDMAHRHLRASRRRDAPHARQTRLGILTAPPTFYGELSSMARPRTHIL